ncbi:hypothetical protein AT3G46735 [Arabidopsis thaliana]|uniref:Uncharacterized protein n=1 Tax=Arabidopsis thaliana TaxID=3702 RepID=A0A1I9LQA8_ARATH|nr:uncharacterized protein AT3G46735 [Arabidopsis thaliana]ANM64766.1 hypothetical protein AT3G46735 [Arabidopsis thaliana]|eukprot:NP_001326772.1 hypothetical protein AT3G46735 [Arabidopsis thaliana]
MVMLSSSSPTRLDPIHRLLPPYNFFPLEDRKGPRTAIKSSLHIPRVVKLPGKWSTSKLPHSNICNILSSRLIEASYTKSLPLASYIQDSSLQGVQNILDIIGDI